APTKGKLPLRVCQVKHIEGRLGVEKASIMKKTVNRNEAVLERCRGHTSVEQSGTSHPRHSGKFPRRRSPGPGFAGSVGKSGLPQVSTSIGLYYDEPGRQGPGYVPRRGSSRGWRGNQRALLQQKRAWLVRRRLVGGNNPYPCKKDDRDDVLVIAW